MKQQSSKPSGGQGRHDGGAAAAELAIALPGVVVVVLALAWLLAVMGAQLRCTDAAAEAARALGRGERVEVARAIALQVAPAGAIVTLQPAQGTSASAAGVGAAGAAGAGLVRVRVDVQLSAPLSGVLALPGVRVSSAAVALAPPAQSAQQR